MDKSLVTYFNRILKSAVVVLLLTCYTGCTVGPDYSQPEVDVPAEYVNSVMTEKSASSEELAQWWNQLQDPLLTDIIAQALQDGPDIRAAVAKVAEARAQLAYVTGEKYPNVYKSGKIRFGRASKNDGLGTTVLTDIPGVEVKDTPYLFTGVVASWEIDLFGRIRRAIESSTAYYQASLEEYRSVRVALAADIAIAYINVRTLQKRVEIAKFNIDQQRQGLEIVELRHQEGHAPKLEIAQAKANLAASESLLPLLQKDLIHSLNSLSVLIGQNPGVIDSTLATAAKAPSKPVALPARLPAELLRRRPDIRNAERLLASQTAKVGIATADLYPRFVLFGYMGTESIKSDKALDTSSFTYTIGPHITWRLFDGNRVRSAIAIENARVDQALVKYEKTVLNALREAENAQAAYRRYRQQHVHLANAVSEYQQAVILATQRYKEGQVDFLNVLDSERSLLALQDQLAQSNALQMTSLVFIYRSLGGGWEWNQDSPETAK